MADIKSGIPPVPQSFSGADKIFLQQLKESLDVLTGAKERKSKAITANDLVEMGFAKYVTTPMSGEIEPTNNEVVELEPIPQPTNLSAVAGFENIMITFDLKQYSGHSAVQIFRNSTDDISTATLLAEVSGFTVIFSDPVGENVTFYYWVRAVNVVGDKGPFNSGTGTSATTQTNNAALIADLSGSITSSELATSLTTPINKIDGIESLLESIETYTGYTSTYDSSNSNDLLSRLSATESVASNASSSASTLSSSLSTANTAISNLQTAVEDLTSGTTSVYVQDDAPTGTISTYSRWYDSDDNMKPYVRIDANGDGTETWESLEDPRIGDNESNITDLNAEVFNSDGSSRLATSTALSTLDSTVTNINNTVTSHASSITALDGAVFNDDDTVKLATTSALDSLTSSVEAIYDAEDDTSLVQVLQADVTSLESEVFNEDGTGRLATSSALSSLSSTVTSQGSSISTAESSINSLNSAVFAEDDTVQLATTSALSGLQSEVDAIYKSDDDTSLVRVLQSSVTDLTAEVFTETDGEQSSRLATAEALSTLSQDVEDAEGDISSLQSYVTSLNSTVYGSDDGGSETILATGDALDTLTNTVEAIYSDDADTETVVSSIQSDISSLTSEVFHDVDGQQTGRLATADALSSLTSSVEAIYDGDEPSVVTSIQSDISDLNAVVFDDDELALATVSALDSLDSAVKVIYDPDNTEDTDLIQALQSSVTSLTSEVFQEVDGVQSSRLATGSALSSLQNDVEAIYDGDNESLVKSLQESVTSLNSALYNDDSTLKLATAEALQSLQTEVFGEGNENGASASILSQLNTTVNHPTTGLSQAVSFMQIVEQEVYGSGGYTEGGVSRIDSLSTEVFDDNGNVKLATASAVSELTTELFGSNAEVSRLDSLDAEVFSEDGESRLASASFVENINIELFNDATDQTGTSVTRYLNTKVEDIESTITTHSEILDTENGLAANYAVKIDNNGHISGFGLATTPPSGVGEDLAKALAGNLDLFSSNRYYADYEINGYGFQIKDNGHAYRPQWRIKANSNSGTSPYTAILEITFHKNSDWTRTVSVTSDDGAFTRKYVWSPEDATLNKKVVKRITCKFDGTETPTFFFQNPYVQGETSSAGKKLIIEDISLRVADESFSDFIIAADRFAIVDPAGNNAVSPFYVKGGNTYIQSAFMADASIDVAQIRDLTVDFANVTGTLSATKISGGVLDTGVLNIDNSTIKEVDGKLALGSISANSIESGEIDAGSVTIKNLFASSIKGDISKLTTFRQTTSIGPYTRDTAPYEAHGSIASGIIGKYSSAELPRMIHISMSGTGKFNAGIEYTLLLKIRVSLADDSGDQETTSIKEVAQGKRNKEPIYHASQGYAFAYLDGDVRAEFLRGWNLTSRFDGTGISYKGNAGYVALGEILDIEYLEQFDYTKIKFDPIENPSQRGSASSGYYWYWGTKDKNVARYPSQAENAMFGASAQTQQYTVARQTFRPSRSYVPEFWSIQGGLDIPTRHYVQWTLDLTTSTLLDYTSDRIEQIDGLIMELR